MSYNSKTWREQGGNFVVGSSGTMTLETGAKLALAAVTETTAATLASVGISVVRSTGTKKIYKIGAPFAGAVKHIAFTVPNATGYVHVSSTGTRIYGTGVGARPSLKAVGSGGVTLVGLNATNWHLVGKSTTVSLATSTT